MEGFQEHLAKFVLHLRNILPTDKQNWCTVIERTPLPLILVQFRTKVVPSYRFGFLSSCLKIQMAMHKIQLQDLGENDEKAKKVFAEIELWMQNLARYVINLDAK